MTSAISSAKVLADAVVEEESLVEDRPSSKRARSSRAQSVASNCSKSSVSKRATLSREEREEVDAVKLLADVDVGNWKQCKILAKLDAEYFLAEKKLWPVRTEEEVKLLVLLLGHAAPAKKDLFLETMLTVENDFASSFEKIVLVFSRLDPVEDRALGCAFFDTFTFFFGRLDKTPVRFCALKMHSFLLWELVSESHLEKHLDSMEKLREQWKRLRKSKKTSKTERTMIHNFWKSVFAMALNGKPHEAMDACALASLRLISQSLLSSSLRQFLQLLVEDGNLLPRCETRYSDKRNTGLRELGRALICATKTDDQVQRMIVARTRLLQRVAHRHFEKALPEIYLVPVSQAQKRVREVIERHLQTSEIVGLCTLLNLTHGHVSVLDKCDRVAAAEESDKSLLLSIIEVAHRDFRSHKRRIEDFLDARRWCCLPSSLLPLPFDSLEKLEKGCRMVVDTLCDRESRKLESASEHCVIFENLDLLQQSSQYALAYDLHYSLRSLRPAPQNENSIRFETQARMAIAVQLRGQAQLIANFAETPPPIIAEWVSLSASKSLTFVCALSLEDEIIMVHDVFPAKVKSVDPNSGRINVSWVLNELRPSQKRSVDAVYVLIRRNWRNDLPRKIGQAITSSLRGTPDMLLFPEPLQPYLLGQTSSAQRKNPGCPLMALEKKLAEQVEAVLEYSLREPSTLVVAPDEETALAVVKSCESDLDKSFTRIRRVDLSARVTRCLQRRLFLLNEINRLAAGLGIGNAAVGLGCESAAHFYEVYVNPELQKYEIVSKGKVSFPFAFYFGGRDNLEGNNEKEIGVLRSMFSELESYRVLELVQDFDKRLDFILYKHSKILIATIGDLVEHVESGKPPLQVQSVAMVAAGRISEADLVMTFAAMHRRDVKSCALFGDPRQEVPLLRSTSLSVLEKYMRLGFAVDEHEFGQNIDQVVTLCDAKDRPPGFLHRAFFFDTFSDEIPLQYPDEFQNVVEAEASVALFHYMLALGFPSSQVAILTPYNAQKLLIVDVIHARSPQFGLPFPVSVATFDENGSTKHKHVILSLVRSVAASDLGHSDYRRSLQAASCAKEMLAVVASQALFRNNPAFKPIFAADHRLTLCFGELYGSTLKEKPSKTFSVNALPQLSAIVTHLLWNRPLSVGANILE